MRQSYNTEHDRVVTLNNRFSFSYPSLLLTSVRPRSADIFVSKSSIAPCPSEISSTSNPSHAPIRDSPVILLKRPEPSEFVPSFAFTDIVLLVLDLFFQPTHPPDLWHRTFFSSCDSPSEARSTYGSGPIPQIRLAEPFNLGLILDRLGLVHWTIDRLHVILRGVAERADY
jgi:hypothetical protein